MFHKDIMKMCTLLKLIKMSCYQVHLVISFYFMDETGSIICCLPYIE